MNPVARQINELFEPVLTDMGYELVGVEYRNQGRGSLLRVYIDHENGITLDDCSAVSHQLSAILDVEDPIAGHYDLEVSSPGMDRPLFTEAHYRQFIGQRVKIVMAVPQHGRRRFTGELRNFADNMIDIEVDNELYSLPLEAVASARLVPDYGRTGA